MASGGQCVMTSGTALMLLWFASSWDMHTLEVSALCNVSGSLSIYIILSISHSHTYRWQSI